MKFLKLLLPALLFLPACFAQDSTFGEPTGSGTGWISTHYITVLSIIYALYELVVRYVPTVKNYSIVGFVIKLIQTLVPNVSKTGRELK